VGRRSAALFALPVVVLLTIPEWQRGRAMARRGTLSAAACGVLWHKGVFNELALAALHLTTELLTMRRVSAATFDHVHEALGSEATVELLMVINRYSGLELMLNALDVDLDETARLPIPPTRNA
jgi:alkylhydroperoxidase family enzyme